MTEASKPTNAILSLLLPTALLVVIVAVVLAGHVSLGVLLAIVGGAALMTWIGLRATTWDIAGMQAATARATAVGAWDAVIPATMIDGDRMVRGLLARHPDRIGFFPIASVEDLAIPRSAITAIEGITRPPYADRWLRIQWLGDRIEERVFAAGPDLSPWTEEPPAPLPRATAKIHDDE